MLNHTVRLYAPGMRCCITDNNFKGPAEANGCNIVYNGSNSLQITI